MIIGDILQYSHSLGVVMYKPSTFESVWPADKKINFQNEKFPNESQVLNVCM